MNVVILSGPGLNLLTLDALETLLATLQNLGEKAFIIHGKGEVFSAGLDIKELIAASPERVELWMDRLEAVVQRLFLHPAPTVAAINGHAIAGGLLLALCCDCRIATNAPNTRFGMTGVSLGLLYPPFVHAVVRSQVPPPHAERLLLWAERFGPEEALSRGLVHELAPPEKLMMYAEARLGQLQSLSPKAYRATKLEFRKKAYEKALQRYAEFRKQWLPEWTKSLSGRSIE
ncbi:MAG: enoyl-CoA hydratase/isomerase family protein [Sandaracinaceae bacterium]|nr:enoyl-CoA hydratase/isomerase family protein [Sandaracinaceae bacterium]